MASKISGIDTAPITSVGAGRAVQKPQDATSGGVGANTSQSSQQQDVQITGIARQLADLEQKVRDLPAVNEQRVAQIRSSIEQGTYTVRPQHIADQLMSLERTLSQLPDQEDAGAER